MSSTYTSSSTYTVVDVRKVMDQIRADVRMIAQSSGLWTLDYADRVMNDVTLLAEDGYLKKIQIRAVGWDGKNVRVADYPICEDAQGWTPQHSGDNLWKVAARRLAATLTWSDKWNNLTAAQEAAVRSKLSIGWTTSTDDLSVAHLQRSPGDRTYVSNGYGVRKTVYK